LFQEKTEIIRELKDKNKVKKTSGLHENKENSQRLFDLEEECKRLEKESDDLKYKLSTTEDTLSTLTVEFDKVTEERNQGILMQKAQNESIDRLKKEMTDMTTAQRNEKSKASNFNKQRSDAIEESRRQHMDNTALQEEVYYHLSIIYHLSFYHVII